VHGCMDADYVDATGSGASRTITFGGVTPGLAYSPKCLKIAAGQTVTFSGDFVSHPLSETCGAALTITPTATGSTAMFTFTTTGDFGYQCDIHGPLYNMNGAIRVQ
jgi:plastocyanin